MPPAESLIDSWEKLGNEGWNWENLQWYFSKSYTNPAIDGATSTKLGIEPASARNDEAMGPIQTSFTGDPAHPIRKTWIDMFRERGESLVDDPFLHGSVGAFSCLSSIDSTEGQRSYSASAYYDRTVRARSNLRILTNAYVEKILFETTGQSARAVGVQFSQNGNVHTVNPAKEVILAAGAFQSPKLLELSGVGDSKLLRSHGIEVIEDLPGVGENLHDHLISSTAFEAAKDPEATDALARQEPGALAQAPQQFGAAQSGPLTSLGASTYAYLPLPAKEQDALKPLLALHRPAAGTSAEQARARAIFDITEEVLLDPKQPSAAYLTTLGQAGRPLDDTNGPRPPASSPSGPDGFTTFGVMLSHPLSRGSAHIRSADPSAAPVIDPRYLSHPLDVEVVARHAQQLRGIASSPPLRRLLANGPPPACRDLDAARDHARASLVSAWHFVGTCAMMPRGSGGVVDPELRVYGLDNVRVVDASAIPLVSAADVQATVYAFAERAADLIKERWGQSYIWFEPPTAVI